MRRFWIAVASLAASALTLIWNSYWPRSTPKTAVTRAFEVPAAFIENRGQVDARVAYYVKGRNANIFFEKQAITSSLRERTRRNQTTLQPTAAIAKPRPAIWNVKVDFLNSNPAPAIEATTKVATAVSYFRSERAHEWKSRSVACESIVYREVWPGIDLHFSGERAALKYQFVVRPGADPQRIRFRYRGANSIEVTPDGNVHIATPNGTLIDDAPVSWQVTTSDRVAVTSRFDVSGDEVGFFVGPYDRSRELIIDPATVLYSGYIGGNGTDAVLAMAVDPSGNAYIAGSTSSPMFPTVIGPDTTYNGETDAFVAKVNSSGTGLLYVGYLGGSGNDIAYSLAVDADGAAYVSGLTESSDFPVRGGPDTTYNGGTDGFVAKINPQGSALVYSGFVGGSGEDCVFGISLDTAKNLYITGYTYSSNFPVTGGPDLTYNGDRDGFVGKLNSEGTGFSYLGYLGGTGHDSAQRIVVDSSGASYVAGSTYSADYPATNSHSSTVTLSGDAFITKVEASGAALGFSRYLGGSNLDTIWGLQLDAAGFIYIAGYTFSTDFPVVVGPYLQHKGRDEAFVAKIPPSGDGFIYCGLLAGSNRDAGWDLAVDSVGNAYVVGLTSSPDFPIVNATDSTPNGDLDAFIAKVNARGSKVVFSTFLGGSSIDGASAVAVEPEGNIIVAGSSWWSDFPVIG